MQKTDMSGAKTNIYFKIVKAVPPQFGLAPSLFGYGYEDKSPRTITISEDEFRHKISQLAVQRYPELFRDTPEAIPIDVLITAKNSTSFFSSSLLMVGSLGIIGAVLPLPTSGTSEFAVKIDIPDTATSKVAYRRKDEVSFVRKDVTWTTYYSPLGLISIPGESVATKTSEFGEAEAFKTGGQLTLEGFVDAVAVSLKNMDINKLPAANSGLSNKTVTACTTDVASGDPIIEKFNRIKALRDNGSITEQEYQSAREKLVNQL
jgi:hypothetical protein